MADNTEAKSTVITLDDEMMAKIAEEWEKSRKEGRKSEYAFNIETATEPVKTEEKKVTFDESSNRPGKSSVTNGQENGIDELLMMIQEINLTLAEQKEENQALSKKLQGMERLLNDARRWNSKKCLVFIGAAIPEPTRGENIYHIMKKLIKEKWGQKMSDSFDYREISAMHRIPGGIIVEFVYRTGNCFYANVLDCEPKSKSMKFRCEIRLIKEDLQLFNMAKELESDGLIKACWVDKLSGK